MRQFISRLAADYNDFLYQRDFFLLHIPLHNQTSPSKLALPFQCPCRVLS